MNNLLIALAVHSNIISKFNVIRCRRIENPRLFTSGRQCMYKKHSFYLLTCLVLLEKLLNFFGLFLQHSSSHKMDIEGLATVFAPNLLKRKNETPDSLMKDTRAITVTIIALIENRSQLMYKVNNRHIGKNSL